MDHEHRIILVREWDAQTSGSGCCGRLGGEGNELCGGEYAHNRREMERMGEVYRALRGGLAGEDVGITVADPRNMIWLIPAIIGDGRRGGMSPRELWGQLRRGISYNSVIVDGRVLFCGRVPEPEEALAAVSSQLAVEA